MARLPVVVGFGGVNPAGRSSGHHGFKRMVIDALPEQDVGSTYQSLARLMGQDVAAAATPELRTYIRNHSLIRKIEKDWFDTENIATNRPVMLNPLNGEMSFVAKARQLPPVLPEHWQLSDLGEGQVRVDISQGSEFLVPTTRQCDVRAAGQLPTGFHPESLYQSRNHPRGLQLAIYAASDAVESLGIPWETVSAAVRPDQISVYASSAMAQLDDNGNGGLLSARLGGKRVSSKHLALGLADMPSDFVNAYVLGSVGSTGPSLGACATFLFNLRAGIQDIQSGRSRIAIVGAAEAPINPDVIDGYVTMGALATDEAIMRLEGKSSLTEDDYRRTSRPFGDNCGFTLSESSQFVVLFDDELALELGACIYASVPGVYTNADGFKKSISSPGAGNYLTVGKAAALARAILGEDALKTRSFVQAHGTSTPQNRVTESHILNEVAKAMGIASWPVAAIKAFLGHSLGSASGDQMIATLGSWRYGILPGIVTVDQFAPDLHASHLSLTNQHTELGQRDIALLNSKGFGGNNATALVLSAEATLGLLEKRHGKSAMTQWRQREEQTAAAVQAYDDRVIEQGQEVRYFFDHNVIQGEDIEMSSSSIKLPGFSQSVDLNVENPYAQWSDSE